MSVLPHWIHIYDKPAEGDAFKARYRANGYQHKINVMGWFDTANCEIALTQAEAELFFSQYVGNRVAVFVDNPAEPIWEGFISTAYYTAGGLEFRRSMDNMANRVYVNYDKSVAGTFTTEITGISSVTDSQSIYGIKEVAVKGRAAGGIVESTSFDLLRARKVAEVSFPQTSVTQKSGGNSFIKIEMRGFYDTLAWEKVQTNRANSSQATLMTTDSLPDLLNTSTFLDNTDFTEIDTPGVSVTSTSRQKSGETIWDLFQNIAEFGDGTNLWIVGVTETKSNGKRRVYYRASNRVVELTARTDDGLRIRNTQGGLLRPWTIKPDKIVRVNDILVGWGAIGSDPRETYIKAIAYKQVNNSVVWSGEDDINMEGVMRTFSTQRDFNRVFGQRPNQIVF
jgi:hypothetical protein